MDREDMLTVDDIWLALYAIGRTKNYYAIEDSAKRLKLYLNEKRKRLIPFSRLGDLTKDLGIMISPDYLMSVLIDTP